MSRDYISLIINGTPLELRGHILFNPLSETIRSHLALTGTKVVCSEGDCGACTVLYTPLYRNSQAASQYQSINSCICPTWLMDSCHVVTVEGLKQNGSLNEVQDSMIRNFGVQCGFCTPGFVMAITDFYERGEPPNEIKINESLSGNLCRCTGYHSIIKAALNVEPHKYSYLKKQYPFSKLLEMIKSPIKKTFKIEDQNQLCIAPLTLKKALKYKNLYKKLKIIGGGTDLGVLINKHKVPFNNFMSLHRIEELYELSCKKNQIIIGAKVTLAQFEKFIEKKVYPIYEFMKVFASPQIKHLATLVGNIANGSPIADTAAFLLALDAQIELRSIHETRTILLQSFYKGYKSLDIKKDEIITHIKFHLPNPKSQVGLYKISQRYDLDISCVNACFIFEMDGLFILDCRIVYGGVGPTPLRLNKVEKILKGQLLSCTLIKDAKKMILENILPISDLRGSKEYRQRLCERLFDKYIKEQLPYHLIK